MKKKNSSLFTTLLISTLLFINPITSMCREGYDLIEEKKKTIQRDTQFLIYRSVSGSDDDDFIKEPKKIIEFWIDHLLVRPTDTIQYGTLVKLKTDIGKTVSYSYSIDGNDKKKIGLELTPLGIENRKINIDIKVFLGQKIIKEEKVFAQSLNRIFVELFENKEKQEKFADEIIPLIRTINPPVKYPFVVEELKFLNYMLFINQKLVKRTIYVDLTVPGGSKDNPIFVGFYIEGRGMYVMSFCPFEGAEPIGVCRDNVMKFKHRSDLFEFVSLKPIMPEGRWLVWVRINPFYDPLKDLASSEDHREKLQLTLQKKDPYVSFWFYGKEILERVFGEKKKN